MIKINDQSERQYTGWYGFLVAQTTVKRHENKNKKQNNHKKKNRKIKNNRKVKAMGKITPTMDHYPRNGEMGDTDP